MENSFSENDRRHLFDEEFTLPPSLAWDQVEQGIRRPRKKKRRLPFFLIFVCGMTVVTSVFSFFFLEKTPVGPNTMVAETSEKFLNKNNDSVVATLEKEGLTEEKKQDNSQKRQPKKTTSFTDSSIINKQEAGTFPAKNEFENTMPALISSEENVWAASEKNKLILTEEPETIRLLPTLSFSFLLINNGIASKKLETNIKPLLRPKKNLLQLELSGGTVLTNNIYPSENERINAEMQTALSQPIAYSLHGGILFQRHKNIFFGAGFRFTEMKSLFSYTETSTREVVQENAITQVTFNTFTSEHIVTSSSSRTDVETLQRTVKKINRLQITELPLTIGYALLKNKWQVRVSGEIGLASIGFSGFVLDENLQLIDYSKATKQHIRGFGYMYGGGVEINRQVADRTSIGLKCRYADYGGRGQMTDFSPRTIGVSLGVKFSLSDGKVIPY